jgi:hypothetical protein
MIEKIYVMLIDVTNEIKRRKRKIECVMDEVHPKKTSKMSEMNEYHLESQSQKLKIENRKSKIENRKSKIENRKPSILGCNVWWH